MLLFNSEAVLLRAGPAGEGCTMVVLLETHPSMWSDLQRMHNEGQNGALKPVTYIEQVKRTEQHLCPLHRLCIC